MVGLKFYQNVEKWLKAQSELAKLENKFTVLSDTTNRRYPPGVKPFRSPAEATQLDRVWPAAAEGLVTFLAEAPRGATRREAWLQCTTRWLLG